MSPNVMTTFELCARCGRCLVSCPVFEVTKRETLSPRGRLSLVEELSSGGLTQGAPFFTCLLCGACEDACPNKVPLLEAFCSARIRLSSWSRRSLARGANMLLASLDKGLDLLTKAHLREPSFTKRFSLPKKGEVSLFLGCGANFLYPSVTEILVRSLEALGFSLGLPPDQGCCGLVFLALGDQKSFYALARKNIEALRGERPIITLCASCYFALKEIYPRLLKDKGLGEEASLLAARVFEATDFLLRSGAQWRASSQVCLHLPCHLRFATGTKWWRLSPYPLIEHCCGQGGSFALFYPELSQKIEKSWRCMLVERVDAPRILLTNCTACFIRLKKSLPPPVEIRFPLEYLHISPKPL